ncbi:MAG: phage tail protein [Candidatus Adiutrix sp.]|jgi:hypothetical protein|nr:phage tail protein [Candidatus Adiutrix sp.]
MPIPTPPSAIFKRPFAAAGQKQTIPDTASLPGRASLTDGFPPVSQLPLNQGGLAPNRLDFNGLFNMLSAFAFWQQSGGLFAYSAGLNYAPPAWVVAGAPAPGRLWWCLAPNGPETERGPVAPGTDEAVWQDFFAFLAGGGGLPAGTPVGAVVMFPVPTAPAGYLPCDGSSFSAAAYPKLYALLGKTVTPDMRGLFPRGYDPAGLRDPDGAGRAIGSTQADAIKSHDVAAYAGETAGSFLVNASSGPLILREAVVGTPMTYYGAARYNGAEETRAKNMSLLFCIKHD